jgi:hypothetical protein
MYLWGYAFVILGRDCATYLFGLTTVETSQKYTPHSPNSTYPASVLSAKSQILTYALQNKQRLLTATELNVCSLFNAHTSACIDVDWQHWIDNKYTCRIIEPSICWCTNTKSLLRTVARTPFTEEEAEGERSWDVTMTQLEDVKLISSKALWERRATQNAYLVQHCKSFFVDQQQS